MLKRTLDLSIASIGLAVFALLLPVLATAITLSSPGPILFRQIRVGRHGQHFTCYKLRTMHHNAPPVTYGTDRPEDDPRIHKAGRFLRKVSLDELPQFINVLKGDMSIVGPRPFVPAEAAQLPSERLQVRPGITGPWQVCDRSETNWDEVVALDCRYAEYHPILVDLTILAKTPLAALRNR